eukprot:4805793-Prymnesium_polylepis.1
MCVASAAARRPQRWRKRRRERRKRGSSLRRIEGGAEARAARGDFFMSCGGLCLRYWVAVCSGARLL